MEEMIAFWEELEIVENTPVWEQVARRQNDRLLNIFRENLKWINNEDIVEITHSHNLTEYSREGSINYTTLSNQGYLLAELGSAELCGIMIKNC